LEETIALGSGKGVGESALAILPRGCPGGDGPIVKAMTGMMGKPWAGTPAGGEGPALNRGRRTSRSETG